MTEQHPQGRLSIVATPIGNLSDMTQRAKTTLEEADLILCEDTRVTKKLLNAYGISTPTMSFHHHSDAGKYQEVQTLLAQGKHLAYVSDAGTPGISDPGGLLVASLVHEQNDSTPIITPIPGPSSLTAALSVSGFAVERFLFLGFAPHKNKRKLFVSEIAASEYSVAFCESSHRMQKALMQLSTVLEPSRRVCICRELTKKFKQVVYTTAQHLSTISLPEKGECVIVVEGNRYAKHGLQQSAVDEETA